MKLLTPKILSTLVFFAFLTVSLSAILDGTSAFAVTSPEKLAADYCAKIKGPTNDPTIAALKAACTKGFMGGYNGGSKTTTCKGLTASNKTACEDAFDAGKKLNTPEITGREGAAAGVSKEDACRKYKNAANLAACKKAYDNQLIAMAGIEGKRAGEAGEDSPCGTYKLAAAKLACENAYKKGQVTLGKSANGHCGEVATYFDFSKTICKDPDLSVRSGGNNSPIIAIGLGIVGIVTSLVAIAVVGGIIYGGFLYLTARDSSSQTEKGVTVIVNSVVALIVWVFAYALINFLIPGGLFNG